NAAVLGASAFWLVGGMLQMNLVIHCRQVYHVSNSTTGFVMACAAIGIALGSFVAGKISGNEVKKGFVLFGSGSMSLLFAIITFVPMGFVLFVACVSGIAFMGGFFQIPCLSMVQKADVGRKLGDMIGYLNLVTFIFVLAGTGFFSLTTFLTHENSYAVFGVITAVCLFVSGYFFKRSPGFRNETAAMLGKIFR
ncbi:MAG TPA: MFS transporter, partial [Paludibacter sp.]|nr:MFS transporter [Paludibacter sp.]